MLYYLTKAGYQTDNDKLINKLILGTKVHSELYNEFYHRSNSIESMNEAILHTRQDGHTRSTRELRLFRETDHYSLVGRVDEVRIRPDKIENIDDKNSRSIRDPYIKIMYQQQLELYCDLFIDHYTPFQDIEYILRKAKSDPEHLFFKNKYTGLSFDLQHTIDILLEWWSGDHTLVRTSDANKCKNCRLAIPCKENV